MQKFRNSVFGIGLAAGMLVSGATFAQKAIARNIPISENNFVGGKNFGNVLVENKDSSNYQKYIKIPIGEGKTVIVSEKNYSRAGTKNILIENRDSSNLQECIVEYDSLIMNLAGRLKGAKNLNELKNAISIIIHETPMLWEGNPSGIIARMLNGEGANCQNLAFVWFDAACEAGVSKDSMKLVSVRGHKALKIGNEYLDRIKGGALFLSKDEFEQYYGKIFWETNNADTLCSSGYENLGYVLLQQADQKMFERILATTELKQALIFFQKAEELAPTLPGLKKTMANIDYTQQKYGKAENEFLEAIACDETDGETHNDYANLLYRQERYTEAFKEYDKAVRLGFACKEERNNAYRRSVEQMAKNKFPE